MKNIKKILAAVALLAVLCVGIALTATADGEDPHTCTAEELAEAQTLLDAVNLVKNEETGFWNTASAKRDVDKVNVAVKGHDLSGFNGADAFYAKLDATNKAVDEAVFANRMLLESEAELSEYDNFRNVFVDDFEDGKEDFPMDPAANATGKIYTDDNGNTYYSLEHYAAGQAYHQFNFEQHGSGFKPDERGFVMEFDLATFTNIPTNGIVIENGSTNMYYPTVTKGYPVYLRIDKDGNLKSGPNTLLFEEAIVPGAWTHFSFVYDPNAFEFRLYVDYELVATYPAYSNVDGGSDWSYKYIPTAIRLSANGVGSWSIDNFNTYAGTHIIDQNKFKVMSDDEKFNYYSDYLADDNKGAEGRRIAYDNATTLVSKYWDGTKYTTNDPTLRASVDKYLAFDYDMIVQLVSQINRDKFIQMVENLLLQGRSLENVTARNTDYVKITEFLTSCGNEIVLDADYNAANERLRALNKEINTDKNALNFIKAINRFDQVDSLKGRQKYYNKANNLAHDNDYPVGQDFYAQCKADNEADPENNVGFVAFIEAYEKYLDAGTIVFEHQLRNNAQAIISCVQFIDDYFETPEEWFTEENYDYINRYILIVRDIVNNQGYDENYEGIDAALEIFVPMNEAFYEYLQQQHIAEISKYLDLIAATDSYIEKMGMCSYVTRYFNEKDIDFTREDIITLQINHATYLAELDLREDDYGDLLIQNSYYFSNLVEKMTLADSYAQKKDLFDQAAFYYFSLDASVGDTSKMIEIFDGYSEVLANIEDNSNQFIVDVAVLVALLEDEKTEADALFEALVLCADSYKYADDYFAGVAEARVIYQAAADAYLDATNVANAEMLSASTAVASVRANSGVLSFVTVAMEKIFG